MNYLRYGDRAVLINFEQRIDPNINQQVHALSQTIDQAQISGVEDLIPAYCSLTVTFDPDTLGFEGLCEKIQNLVNKIGASDIQLSQRKLTIPVCYDGVHAPDMQEIMKQTGLSKKEIIKLHTDTSFQVYMLGFLPGFVFMGILPEKLKVSRKQSPRLKVPPRSVGLAGLQTGIYPSESPGGWQLIGQTPLEIFRPHDKEPFLFQPGDEVRFEAISEEEYAEISHGLH